MLTLFLYINSKKTFSQEDVTTLEVSWIIQKKKKKKEQENKKSTLLKHTHHTP